jgi:hypothetical protein
VAFDRFARISDYRRRVTVRLVRIAYCLAPLVLLAACTSSKPHRTVTVTVTPPGQSSPGSPASSGSNASSATTSPAPVASHQNKINGTCDTLLPDNSVFDAIHVNTLPGTDAFVVGKAEPDINRIAYLNCRYGVTGKGAAATPKVEIGISLYSSARKAADRISATVDDYSAHGATASDTTVSGGPATWLSGGVGADYEVPLLVASSGQRTVAVSVDPSLASGDRARADATALAALALARTAR